MQYEYGSSCVNIWKQFLWKTGRKISWTAQINYNSAIQVINSDQIKYLPPSCIETLDFIKVSTCWSLSRVWFKLKYLPPPAIHYWVSSWLSLTWSAHRQTFILEIKIHNYLHPPLLRGGFKKEDRKVRQILQRNSSGAKAYPRPQSQ